MPALNNYILYVSMRLIMNISLEADHDAQMDATVVATHQAAFQRLQ